MLKSDVIVIIKKVTSENKEYKDKRSIYFDGIRDAKVYRVLKGELPPEVKSKDGNNDVPFIVEGYQLYTIPDSPYYLLFLMKQEGSEKLKLANRGLSLVPVAEEVVDKYLKTFDAQQVLNALGMSLFYYKDSETRNLTALVLMSAPLLSMHETWLHMKEERPQMKLDAALLGVAVVSGDETVVPAMMQSNDVVILKPEVVKNGILMSPRYEYRLHGHVAFAIGGMATRKTFGVYLQYAFRQSAAISEDIVGRMLEVGDPAYLKMIQDRIASSSHWGEKYMCLQLAATMMDVISGFPGIDEFNRRPAFYISRINEAIRKKQQLDAAAKLKAEKK